jgi:hypothetical protein
MRLAKNMPRATLTQMSAMPIHMTLSDGFDRSVAKVYAAWEPVEATVLGLAGTGCVKASV